MFAFSKLQLAFGAALALGFAGFMQSARAESVDEIQQLAQKGLGDDVLQAAVDRTPGFSITPDQIIKLKQSGVSDKIIAAMLRKQGGAPPAGAVIAPNGAPPAVAVAEQGQGTLSLENVDERSWAVRVDAPTETLWFAAADDKAQTLLSAHGGVSLAVPAGAWDVRYIGETVGSSFTVNPNDKTLVLLSRVATPEGDGVYVSVFEKGERKGGGRLTVLRSAAPQTFAPQQYTQQAPQQQQQQQPDPTVTYQQPTQTQVVREYVEPSTTVVYRDPVTVYPSNVYYSTWGYPYHYGSYYSPYYGSGYYSPGYVSPGVGVGFQFNIGGSSHHRH